MRDWKANHLDDPRYPQGTVFPALKITWGIVTLCFLALTGCSTDVNKPDTEHAIMVHAYLYVNEAIHDSNAVLITRTMPVDEYYNVDEAVVVNALVTLRIEGAALPETLHMTAPGYYANSSIRIQPLQTYHLEIAIEGESLIKATTTTPAAYAVQDSPLVYPAEMRHSQIPENYPFTLQAPDSSQIFLVDVYCTEEWENARYINPFADHDRPDDYDEYGGDAGEPRHIFGYFRLNDIEHDGDLYILDWYGAMMAFYGEYDIGFLAIDENYYNYLYREHAERSGGIVGGLGVFASAFRESYHVKILD
ncbi:MAG: DUF4249 family protein [Candidatus Eisenbacteria bacterium]|uniref:DUF4249 family protein n=1 Tax=Eiseniibacteriota bacterium TaxID=2212470 RepID=A0A948RXP8_UNCEI|nr:DUF4249 family protein [Candidatus Eisenbacteria bacterium]MBU1948677.1 DUF4249 family protein [Candidatus Eisenbacteria bacterium]MBU2690987.1 DUF4249 family protein [Candidatus Eisenbacteria bacterium]